MAERLTICFEIDKDRKISNLADGMTYKAITDAIDRLAAYEDLGTIEELTELVKAHKDVRVPMLPCKVGDILYFVDKVNGEEGIFARCITEISCNDWDGIFKIKVGLWGKYDFSDIGKTVFLTREEAEAALKEGDDDRD